MGVIVDFDPYVSFLTNKSATVNNVSDTSVIQVYISVTYIYKLNHYMKDGGIAM